MTEAISQEDVAQVEELTPDNTASQENADPEIAEQDTPDAAPDDAEPPEPEFELVVNGETVKVSLSELQKGYSRESAFTQKSQKLAEERKAFEAVRNQELAEYKAKRQEVLARLEAFATPRDEEPNWVELAEKNPAEYIRRKAKEEQNSAERQQARAVYSQMVAEIQQEEFQALQNSIPEWQDHAVMQAEVKGMMETGKAYGFSDDELAGVLDHRQFRVMRDAMMWRNLQAQKPLAQAKVQAAPPKQMAPAGNMKPKGAAEQARAAFEKNPSIENAAKMLAAR